MNPKWKQARQKADAIKGRKNGRKIAMVTAYDYPTARTLDEAGVDALLVGDSLGMVVMGYADTTEVVMSDILHHTRMVARAKPAAFLIADLPINTFSTTEDALRNSELLMEAGAEAVKLEGGEEVAEIIRAIVDKGIPVVAHIGLLPQRVREEGGYKIKGKTEEEADQLERDVLAVAEAGASLVVVEGVKGAVASRVTEVSPIPTIGIGAGKGTCDGYVVVITDLVGAFPWFVPAFAKPKADFAGIMKTTVREWINEIG